jgi:DNA replication protein DnaC
VTAEQSTVCFTRYYVDKHTLPVIAADLGISEDEVTRSIDREHRIRAKKGNLPDCLRDDAKRTHAVIATEDRICDEHGPYLAQQWELQPKHIAAPAFWGNCPQCNRIWQAEADAQTEAIKSGATLKARLQEAALRSAGIPERFKDVTVWNWQHGMDQQRVIWEWIRDYCNHSAVVMQNGRSFVFFGAPGSGKTHLAIGTLRHFIESGRSGRYTTVMTMLGRIKDTYNKHADETENKVISYFAEVDLLVIDEVGRSLDTQYEVAQFFRILDLRYQNRKPTALVSNMAVEKLREFLGESIVDRLMESSGKVHAFDWPSYRNKKAP